MPHMANLPWMTAYFMLTIAYFTALAQMFQKAPLTMTPEHPALVNKTTKKWMW